MATVTGFSSARMLEIENSIVVNAYINDLGHLILVTKSGVEKDAGPITTFLATTESVGGVELATNTETAEGIDNQRAVTPASLATVLNAIEGYRYQGMIQFTTSGTFTKANYPGLKAVKVRVVGAGGGGGGAGAAGSGNHSAGGGGGGGGYAEKYIDEASLVTDTTITVGAGGAGGTSGTSYAGNAGGTSSFGTQAVATGGEGGGTVTNSALMVGAVGGDGGSGVVGGPIGILATGGPGMTGNGYGTLSHGAPGGGSFMGGGGAGVYTPAGSAEITGTAGGKYGGGGGGASVNSNGSARNGGTGAQGIVIVEVYV
jgi:hypothetical protein